MQLVIATHNVKKAGEMLTILSKRFPDWQFKTLADFPGAPEPEETGSTYAENAAIKAYSAAQFTGLLSIADDAGLEIDALNGQPGLFSKRFAGENTSFEDKMEIILMKMASVSYADRTARFKCAVALSIPTASGIETKVFLDKCEGRIATKPSGKGGFGYDPIFFLPELGKTMADLTAEQKHMISHRGKVLRVVGDFLATQVTPVQ
jgi:XTP/dITP diphosphohydrolase